MTSILIRDTVPAMFAYLNTPVSNVTGNGTTYVIKFDTVLFGSGYNTATGLYTVPVAGNYLLCGSFKYTTIINGANGNLATLNQSGFAYRISEYATTASKTLSNTFCTNGMNVVTAAAGDTLSMSAQLNNGSTASVGIAGGNAPYISWFFVRYIG
jgi:hypothetical protein